MKHSAHHFLLWALLFTSATNAQAAEFFVSTDGNDNHPGTTEKPFGTLERARDAIRTSGMAGKERCTVWLKEGIYRRTKPFSLGSQDSGSSEYPVVYRGVKDGAVRLPNATVIKR